MEPLEFSLVPAVTDMTQLAQMFPVHDRPTQLYVNFDGGMDEQGNQISKFTSPNTFQDIQDILFRTSEIYAPFNVQVSRISGFNASDTSDHGNTTVFVGADDALNTNSNGKFAHSYTPFANSDIPTLTNANHRPNSDNNDVAFVDPVYQSGKQADGTPIRANQSNLQISQDIAHEAGHTFGLGHERDPATGTDQGGMNQLGAGGIPEIMAYDATETYFINTKMNLTGFNNDPNKNPPGGGYAYEPKSVLPYWNNADGGIQPLQTRNSFTYMEAAIGDSPSDFPKHHIAHSMAARTQVVDTSVEAQLLPQAPDFTIGGGTISSIVHSGEYDVYMFQADRGGPIHITLTPDTINPKLNPLRVHSRKGVMPICKNDTLDCL
jgi:hypothetical protein